MDDALVIDCDSCPMQHSTACDDCVVSVLLTRKPPGEEKRSQRPPSVVTAWR